MMSGTAFEHWKCSAADNANNPSAIQGTNCGVDLLEACQDNNIPAPNRRQRDFSLYVTKVQREASYCKNKRMKTCFS